MGFVLWIVCGVVAGFAARSLMPGPRFGGAPAGVLACVGGALTGGLAGAYLHGRSPSVVDAASLLMAVAGALMAMLAYRAIALRYELAPHR